MLPAWRARCGTLGAASLACRRVWLQVPPGLPSQHDPSQCPRRECSAAGPPPWAGDGPILVHILQDAARRLQRGRLPLTAWHCTGEPRC